MHFIDFMTFLESKTYAFQAKSVLLSWTSQTRLLALIATCQSPFSLYHSQYLIGDSMIPFFRISDALSRHPDLFQSLSHGQLSDFFDITFRFMPLIVTSAPRATEGLPSLLPNILEILSLKLQVTISQVEVLWSALGEMLIQEFKSHDRSTLLDIDRELSMSGPNFHLGTSV